MGHDVDFQELMRSLPDLVFVIDQQVRLSYVNDAAREILGAEPADWIGRSVLELVHPDDVAMVVSSASALIGKSMGTPIEVRVQRGDHTWTWLEIVGADALGRHGVNGLVCVARDLTRRRMWEVATDDAAMFQQVVQHAPSITLLLDSDGIIDSVNGAFTRLLGHDPTEVVGHSLVSFATASSASALGAAIDQAGSGTGNVSCEANMRIANGRRAARPIRFEIASLLDDPVVSGLVVTGHDVTELQSAREALEHVASHDSLTGLATRAVLLERLTEVVENNQPAAVVFIDLDRFKPVNDLLGHEAGDELLRTVGERLRQQVRPRDIVARVGGDEFVVLALGVGDRVTGAALCERLEAALDAPYVLRAGPVRIAASVGIALVDAESSVAGLLADADIAMYDAKAARRGDPTRSLPDRHRTADQRRRLADDLAAGLQRGEVVAYLQPIADISTRATTSVEALARWHHPQLGTLEPASFLDLAEDASLDLLLGDIILESACAAVAAVPGELQLAVNFSVAQLSERGLCDRLALILARHGLPPSRLWVEITEHATLARRGGGGRVSPERTLLDLCEMGVSLSLDDFGTGYSSLTHIRRYPLSAIKIDRSFVRGVVHHREDQAVIAAVVGLAGMLGLQVVGEGVETLEQLDALRELRCDAVQGYLVARPMSSDDLGRWMSGAAASDWSVAPLAG